MPVRALVALPLWLIGTLLVELGGAVWGAVLSPVFAAVLSWVAVAVMVMLVFLLAAKTIAPDLPIRKILNKRTVPGILVLCLCFGALDTVLPFFVESYDRFSQLVRAGFSCVCTAVPIAFFMRWNKRRIKKQAEAEAVETELGYEEREKAAREDALEGLPVREYSEAYLESTAIQRKITEKFFEYDILFSNSQDCGT